MAGLTAAGYVAIASAVIGAGTAAVQIDQRKEAEAAAKDRNELASAVEGFKSKQSRIQARRANRVRRADIFAQATNAGTATSSGVSGALGSLRSQGARQVGQANTLAGGRQGLLDLQGDVNRNLSQAQTAGVIGGVLQQGAITSGDVGGALGLFDGE